MNRRRIVISANAVWNIVNFRLGLLESLRANGFEIFVVAPPGPAAARLEAQGIEFHPIEMDSKSVSPFGDLKLLLAYRRILRRIEPDLFLGYTAKPNVYGSLAAHSLGVKVINNVSGLGTAFIRQGLLTRILSGLYRVAFRRSATVFFQNNEDLALFLEKRLVPPEKARLLPGSGVNVDRFRPQSRPEVKGARFTFLLVARLLWDKGVGEFIEAARLVKARTPEARFQLLGFLDVQNRTAVGRRDVDQWVAEGIVDYLGDTDDVRPYLAAADCVVLPSYREGLPRVLLEAGAMAKPVISTDAPGCRDAVVDGETGLLCEPRSASSLAEAMQRMLSMGSAERDLMGAEACARVERLFDEKIVIGRYVEAIADALATR